MKSNSKFQLQCCIYEVWNSDLWTSVINKYKSGLIKLKTCIYISKNKWFYCYINSTINFVKLILILTFTIQLQDKILKSDDFIFPFKIKGLIKKQ